MTHDCSFPGPSGLSINLRINKDLLEPCLYGDALRRILHGAHSMRFHHPSTAIICTKIDEDAAYRQIHTSLQSACSCITVIDDLAYLLLRLPFGSSPAASEFSVVTDIAIDLIMELLHDKSWDPNTILSPNHSFLNSLPQPDFEMEKQFGQAAELFVSMNKRDLLVDGYIDDLITIGIDSSNNRNRIRHAIAVILGILFCPINSLNPIPRSDIISKHKAAAEGPLEFSKVILG